MLSRCGLLIIKYRLFITDGKPGLRFLSRIHGPLKQWKLSPMTLEGLHRRKDYIEEKEALCKRPDAFPISWIHYDADCVWNGGTDTSGFHTPAFTSTFGPPI